MYHVKIRVLANALSGNYGMLADWQRKNHEKIFFYSTKFILLSQNLNIQ
jgi:hypothetical protein